MWYMHVITQSPENNSTKLCFELSLNVDQQWMQPVKILGITMIIHFVVAGFVRTDIIIYNYNVENNLSNDFSYY